MALGLLGTQLAFAQFTITGGGRAALDVFGVRLDDPPATTMGSETTWDGDGPEVVLKVTGETPSGIAGMVLGIKAASSSTNLLRPGNAKVWIKPLDWFKITLGVFEEDDLRYKIGTAGSGFGNYELYIRSSARDENVLFHRFKSSGFGTHITLSPLENLYIGWALGSVSSRSFAALTEDGALNVLKNSQIGAGYTIPGIGFARLQYIGERPFVNEAVRPDDNVPSLRNDANGSYYWLGREAVLGNAAAIQAAFQLTALEGVNIDAAASFPLFMKWEQGDPMYGRYDSVLEIESQRPIVAGLGFDVSLLSPFRFYGRIDIETGSYKKATALDVSYTVYEDSLTFKEGTNLLWSMFVSYDLGKNWILGLDLNLDMRFGDERDALGNAAEQRALGGDIDLSLEIKRSTASEKYLNNYVDLGFGIWARKNFAGVDIRTALTMKLPNLSGKAHAGAKPQLFVPVIFNYSI